MNAKALARKNLDRRFAQFRDAAELARPPRGWVRAIREALGMTTRQLAARLGRAQSVIVDLEKGEATDSISLGSLRKAAEALNCELVYALVPNQPLEQMLRARAATIADRQLARVSHTMALEKQGLTRDGLAAERERLVDELLRGNLKRLWDEQ